MIRASSSFVSTEYSLRHILRVKEDEMKIVVMNSPKALRRLLAKIFGVEINKK